MGKLAMKSTACPLSIKTETSYNRRKIDGRKRREK